MIVGVYGLGRFGSFWSSLLAQKFDVAGFNRTPMEKGPPGVRLVTEDEVLSSDVLFLCTAISSLEPLLSRISPRIQPGTLVFDTCSVKTYPAEVMERLLPPEAHIIATHPMFGPDSGKDGVVGLPLVFTPIRCPGEKTAFWKETFISYGLKLLELSPREHDREAAMTQGITHLIGRVLEEMKLEKSSIATLGYRRLLEIVEQTCNDPVTLFMDLQKYNPYTRQMRERLAESLATVNGMLEGTSKGVMELDTGQSGSYHDKTSPEGEQ